MAISISALIEQMSEIKAGHIAIGRLHALEMLGCCDLNAKERAAAHASLHIELAHLIEDYLSRYFQAKPEHVAWNIQPGGWGEVLQGGLPKSDALGRGLSCLEASTLKRINELAEQLRSTQVLNPGLTLLSLASSLLSSQSGLSEKSLHRQTLEGTERVIRGPRSVPLDPIFSPSYSLLDGRPPKFTDEPREFVPYLWTLAMRESSAADSCALCVFEYDGLPLDFYRDFSKQAWDETRHSLMFLGIAIDLLPALERELETESSLCAALRRFRTTGIGLPVPKEQGFYEAIWNASLEERLILLQIKTEGPAVQTAKERQTREMCVRLPMVRHAFEVDERDETAHASFGWRWFRYLVPDRSMQQEMVEQAELLRGILLLTSISSSNGVPLSDLADRIIGGQKIPHDIAALR